ncbi:MAG: acetyltransferase [Lactobacillales bacterium]|jgi:peptidoglycan/LPS O-acetylase OafA/YrhL|nr:acetyltransferase [Lactobacillales bacterium]
MSERLPQARYIKSLDGLRAIAVIGVLCYHLFPNRLVGGYLGVALFFTISGYLITDLLRQEWQASGTISIKDFYFRRLRRLYPALIVMMVLAITTVTLFAPKLLLNMRGAFFSSLFYVNNWWQILKHSSYFDTFNSPNMFNHLWSLAVEAQYYLIWPILFWIFFKLKKRGGFFMTIVTLSILSAIWMGLLFVPNMDPTRIYYGTDTRIFSILLGCALGIIWPSERLKEGISKTIKRNFNIAGAISLAAVILAYVFLPALGAPLYYGGMFAFSVLSMILLAVSVQPATIFYKIMGNPVFTYIGKRSYGIYLYQFPVFIIYEFFQKDINKNFWANIVIEIIIILVLSEISYHVVENPMRRLDYKDAWTKMLAFFRFGPKKDRENGGVKFFTKRTLWIYPTIVCLLITSFGLATAKNSKFVDPAVAAMKKQIEENAARAKKTLTDSVSDSQVTTNQTADTTNMAYSTNLSNAELSLAPELHLYAFGDSVILAAANKLQEIFPLIQINAEVSRQLYNSINDITTIAQSGDLPQYVIIELGTNGFITEANFDEFVNAIGSDHEIFIVNNHVPTKRWEVSNNDLIAKKAKQYKNIIVIDWNGYVQGHEDWLYEDQVHPKPGEGSAAYASLIAKTVLDYDLKHGTSDKAKMVRDQAKKTKVTPGDSLDSFAGAKNSDSK